MQQNVHSFILFGLNMFLISNSFSSENIAEIDICHNEMIFKTFIQLFNTDLLPW